MQRPRVMGPLDRRALCGHPLFGRGMIPMGLGR